MPEQCTAETCSPGKTAPENSCCCDMPDKLLALADEAWMEVLKDKIKAEIVKKSGAELDKVAALVAETNCAKWSHMVQGKMKCEEYKDKLKGLLTAACKK